MKLSCRISFLSWLICFNQLICAISLMALSHLSLNCPLCHYAPCLFPYYNSIYLSVTLYCCNVYLLFMYLVHICYFIMYTRFSSCIANFKLLKAFPTNFDISITCFSNGILYFIVFLALHWYNSLEFIWNIFELVHKLHVPLIIM